MNGDKERYLTTQHERDDETGLDYRGARYYDADVARFLSLDPLAKDFAAWSPYNYVVGNPVKFIDPDGKAPKDAIIVIGKWYPSGGVPLTGHAGVLLINNKTGATRYFEYGRYDDKNYGMVRSYAVPDVIMGDDGSPTIESLNKVLDVIGEMSFTTDKNNPDKKYTYDITGSYYESDQYSTMLEYAENRLSEGTNGEEAYSLINNNCGDFACEVVNQASDVPNFSISLADFFNSDPFSLIQDLTPNDDHTIFHSNEDGTTQMGYWPFETKYEKPQ